MCNITGFEFTLYQPLSKTTSRFTTHFYIHLCTDWEFCIKTCILIQAESLAIFGTDKLDT